ncbi:MAG: YbaB/EbfC family nucleoid-associated protein [Oscillospiraceae bacterium]|jgi:DNA-binding YbaB/EbfC family protein|nr:YbaB/EbfC family nucleoid-associated protein [Oscillospiraceae bacterium]
MAKSGFRGSMPGGGNQLNMIKQAQKIQAEMLLLEEELKDKRYTASAGGGVVTATVNGKHELVSVAIQPEVVDPDDIETLQDLMVAAVNEALREADTSRSENMSRITGGLNLPF